MNCAVCSSRSFRRGQRAVSRNLGAAIAAFIAVNAGVAQPITAQQEPVDAEPITDEEFHLPVAAAVAARIDQSIVQLGSPRFAERQAADKALVEIGAPAFAKLRAAYLATNDFEVRTRIETIVRTAYFDHHVFNNFGFLGIRQGDTPGPDFDARIQPGHSGIRIPEAIAGYAAEKAGVRAEDVIFALDGQPIPGAGKKAFEAFSAEIRGRGPGKTVTLSVLRNGEELTLHAVLTRPPLGSTSAAGNIGNVLELKPKLGRAKTRFAAWWVKHFERRS